MLRRSIQKRNKAQIFLEYAIICGVMIMVLISMHAMIKRGIQGMIKSTADQIGNQAAADQGGGRSGYLESQYTTTRASMDKTISETPGIMNYIYGDTVTTDTNTIANLGYSEEN